MVIGDPATITPVVVPPALPAAAPRLREAEDGSAAARDRRGPGDGESGTTFRAALDAAGGGGAGIVDPLGTTGQASPSATQRAERRPGERPELDGAVTPGLFDAGAAGQSAADGKVQVAQEHFSASRRYAQAFFAVGGTFAARGETLEVRA
jgi:hypothetical protein